MIKSRKKIFKEGLSSVRNEIRDMFEDIKDGLESAREAGSDVSDIMVVVQTWDTGAPVLVKGAYNNYSGDIRCSADEFVDDHDDLIKDYMRDFDEEVKERNDMLDDILNKMHDDVENGTMDEDDYYDEEMNLIDDTCTWSVSVELSKGRDEIKSTMAVNIESGDADVVDSDTLSVDDVEKWCKKKSESRISRRRGIRRISESHSIFEARDKDGFINLIKQIKPEAKNVVDTMPGYYFNHGFNDSNINSMTKKEASLYRLCSLAKGIVEFDEDKHKNYYSFILTSLVKRINDLVDLKSGLSAAKKDILDDDRARIVDEFMRSLKPIISFIKKQGLSYLSPFDTNVF